MLILILCISLEYLGFWVVKIYIIYKINLFINSIYRDLIKIIKRLKCLV